MKKIIASAYFFLAFVSGYGQNIVRGIVIDSPGNKPLQYVNVGIIDKSIGTVTNADGEFKLILNETVQLSDSIKFSMIGYSSKVFSVADFKKKLDDQKSTTVIMTEVKTELPPVVISADKMKVKTLGNETESKFLGGGFGSQDLGSEIGIRASIKHKDTFIRDLNFFISYNRFDSVTFRVNIYDFDDNKPSENILHENIIVKLGNETGKVTVDLSEYNIIVDDDVLVALEWIGKSGKLEDNVLVLSGSLLNSKTYLRRASHGKWETKSLGLGINVNVSYEKLN